MYKRNFAIDLYILVCLYNIFLLFKWEEKEEKEREWRNCSVIGAE